MRERASIQIRHGLVRWQPLLFLATKIKKTFLCGLVTGYVGKTVKMNSRGKRMSVAPMVVARTAKHQRPKIQ